VLIQIFIASKASHFALESPNFTLSEVIPETRGAVLHSPRQPRFSLDNLEPRQLVSLVYLLSFHSFKPNNSFALPYHRTSGWPLPPISLN